jgi:hypothetical protein
MMKWDDALDVWGVHGMGGFFGTLLIGCFADESVGGTPASGSLFGIQLTCAVITAVYSYIMTIILLKLINCGNKIALLPSQVELTEGLDMVCSNCRVTELHISNQFLLRIFSSRLSMEKMLTTTDLLLTTFTSPAIHHRLHLLSITSKPPRTRSAKMDLPFETNHSLLLSGTKGTSQITIN